jgi:hypothetical protein
MIPLVYIESSVISYMTSRISNNLLIAAHQQVTLDWWDTAQRFELCISDYLLVEIGKGDAALVQTQLALTTDAILLDTSTEVEQLADALITRKAVPAKARLDALHIAVCAVNAIDYLLTWNCKHIANAQTMNLIDQVCEDLGYRCPRLCTPLELMEN